ncbi:alpha/beta hydrolase [Streptomyces sp. NPDC058457]|uniref:alpha/beta hydrolase n=1 Tax=Streptomyces sp. NPDC058457 TaxID=3346507 RepID=UPI0036542623
MRRDSDFLSGGTRCAAWHYTSGDGDRRPCVVMAHAFGCTRDSGLELYAQQFAAAGYDVLLFDFRHLGASDGEPRQLVNPKDQLEDFRAAVAHARRLPGVDSEKIVLWGMSLAGGHVLTVAVEDPRIAAVISVVGGVDMVASSLMSLRRDGPVSMARLSALAMRDAAAALRGKPPVYVPIAGAPGSTAFMTAPGAAEAIEAIAGPTFRNEVGARAALMMSAVRPGRLAKDLTCPVLFQIADLDQTGPPQAIAKAAFAAAGRARVRHYPCDHLDALGSHRAVVAAHQVEFLDSVIGGSRQATEPSTKDGTPTDIEAAGTATSPTSTRKRR